MVGTNYMRADFSFGDKLRVKRAKVETGHEHESFRARNYNGTEIDDLVELSRHHESSTLPREQIITIIKEAKGGQAKSLDTVNSTKLTGSEHAVGTNV